MEAAAQARAVGEGFGERAFGNHAIMRVQLRIVIIDALPDGCGQFLGNRYAIHQGFCENQLPVDEHGVARRNVEIGGRLLRTERACAYAHGEFLPIPGNGVAVEGLAADPFDGPYAAEAGHDQVAES